MAILVGGEALYDLVVTADDAIAAHPGGGPFNTARTIARLEQPVAYLGRLSTDRFGRGHERLLAGDGVGLDAVTRSDDPTTLALAEVDERGGASYRFYAGGTAAAGLTPREALAALPDGVEMLHVGTLGLVLEPLASALEAVVERLAPSALVAVDPNVRPGAIADAPAYRARLDRVLARTHVVKVSGDDLDWLEPGRPWLDAARALLARGPAAVLVTRGGEGAAAVTAGAHTDVEAVPVEVADTIGAGDAFGGGFLAWWRARGLGRDALHDHESVVEATRFAALVAALTCAKPGASPPRLGEVELRGS
ncbi:MAG: fructokinase [Thermoleophilaceae bacterium]|nr:fructokinase [Thermoleophilaceae bacterium]